MIFGFGLKTRLEFGMDLDMACAIIAKFASRQRKIVKSTWHQCTDQKLDYFALGLSGLAKISKNLLGKYKYRRLLQLASSSVFIS